MTNRCGVSDRELAIACARWRLDQFHAKYGHSIPASMTQADGPLTREQLTSERVLDLDDPASQRQCAEKIAAEHQDLLDRP